MKFLSVFFMGSCFLSSIFANTQVLTIQSLQEIDRDSSDPKNTVYYFDIEDTLFDSPYLIGSKGWRSYLAEATEKYNSSKHNWHDIFTLLVAENLSLETVEENTAQFIENLQKAEANVFGLSSKGRNKWYNTPREDVDVLIANQLASVDIDFEASAINPTYDYLTKVPEYYDGVFFSGTEAQGDYFLELFENAPELPKKVVFVSNDVEQVNSVAKALDSLEIDGDCYYYTATNEKTEEFVPLASAIQFIRFWGNPTEEVMSDARAKNLMKMQPTDDARDNYRKIIQLQKRKEESSCE